MRIYILYPAEFDVDANSSLGKKYSMRIEAAGKILEALGHQTIVRKLVDNSEQMRSYSARMKYLGECINEMSQCDAVIMLRGFEEGTPPWWDTIRRIPKTFHLKKFESEREILDFLNI